jgi:hypothetical protein
MPVAGMDEMVNTDKKLTWSSMEGYEISVLRDEINFENLIYTSLNERVQDFFNLA